MNVCRGVCVCVCVCVCVWGARWKLFINVLIRWSVNTELPLNYAWAERIAVCAPMRTRIRVRPNTCERDCMCLYLLHVCLRVLSSSEVAAAAGSSEYKNPPLDIHPSIKHTRGERLCVSLFVLLSISCSDGPAHLSDHPYVGHAHTCEWPLHTLMKWVDGALCALWDAFTHETHNISWFSYSAEIMAV